ncbi:hypothetical protein BsWGS_16765 [Bradybaena similaris]
MPPTITNEKSAYSTSAPGKSPPTSPSVFVFPEKTSHPGVSPPRYGRRYADESWSTSSWLSQVDSPPKYGRQNSPGPSITSSCFSHEDSRYTPSSPSFQYHVDSATLFGNGEFNSPCSDPKLSCPLESKVDPNVSHSPQLPQQHAQTTVTPDTRRHGLDLSPKKQSSSRGKRIDASRGLPSEKRPTYISDSQASPPPPKPPPLPPPRTPPQQTHDTRRYGFYLSPKEQSPPRGRRVDASLGSSSEKRQTYISEAHASPPPRIPPPGIPPSLTPPPQTPPPQKPPPQTHDTRRYGFYMSPKEQSPPRGRRIDASLGSSSDKRPTYISESQAAPPPQIPPTRISASRIPASRIPPPLMPKSRRPQSSQTQCGPDTRRYGFYMSP